MNPKERIVERIHEVEMAEQEIRYPVMPLPKAVIVRTEKCSGKVEFTKQRRIRKMERMPPKSKEGMEVNKREIAKRLEKVKKDKMKNANRILNDTNRIFTEIHIRIPIIYYAVMVFGLASAIFGAVNVRYQPIYSSVIIGGIVVFLVGFIGFLEVIYKRRSIKITRWRRTFTF